MQSKQGSGRAHLSVVDKKTRGQEIKRRAAALGLDESKLARRTGVDRSTLRRVFAGGSRDDKYVFLEEWLDREERRVNADEPAAQATGDHVVFRFTGNFGVTAAVEGPVSDIAALRAAATELFHEMQKTQTPQAPAE